MVITMVETCPTDDMLEEYSFERLAPKATEDLEEHLLICQSCQNRLKSIDEYIGVMKAATRKLEQEKKKKSLRRVSGEFVTGLRRTGPMPSAKA